MGIPRDQQVISSAHSHNKDNVLQTEGGEEAMSVSRFLVTVVTVAIVTLTIAIAVGMRMEYARGEREFSELVQWGALPFIILGSPIALWLGLVVANSLWSRRSAGKRGLSKP